MAIDHDRRVLPHRAGIYQIVLDPERTRHAHAAIHSRRNRYPAAVADRGDQLAGLVKVANELQHIAVAAELVGHEAAWNDEPLEVAGPHPGDRRIGHAGIAILAGVATFGLLAGDGDRRAGLDQPQLWIPQLQVLVHIADKGEDAFTGKRA